MEQIVVWPGTVLGTEKAKEFETWIADNGFTAKYLTEFRTLPTMGSDGKFVKGTGGRNDLLFELDDSVDTGKFSLWRLNYGMRWWEDYLDNGAYKIVPQQILNKYPYGWGNNPQKYIKMEEKS